MPGALNGIPGKRLAADATRPLERFPDVRRAGRLGKRRWAIVAWPVPAWAERVYPEVKPETAQRKLARDLLDFCRVGAERSDAAPAGSATTSISCASAVSA